MKLFRIGNTKGISRVDRPGLESAANFLRSECQRDCVGENNNEVKCNLLLSYLAKEHYYRRGARFRAMTN